MSRGAHETWRTNSLVDIVTSELALEQWQFESRSGSTLTPSLAETYLELDCLVHSEWLGATTSQPLVVPSLPKLPPPFSHEKVHWLLQPSCSTLPPLPWQRVHICCIRKSNSSARGRSNHRGLLMSRNEGSLDTLHSFLTHITQESVLSSWTDLTSQLDWQRSKADGTSIGRAKPLQLSSTFMSQLVSELYDSQLKQLSPSKLTDQSSSSSDSSKQTSPSLTAVGSVDKSTNGREALSALLVAMESDHTFYLVYKYHRFTLFDIIIHSPAMLENSTSRLLFILYQLLLLLSFSHGRGVTLGDINLNNIFIDDRLWVQFYLPPSALCLPYSQPEEEEAKDLLSQSSTPISDTVDKGVDSPPNSSLGYLPPALSVSEAVQKWTNGELSNFDYLMLLNYHTGRRLGDPNNHPILPWVTDFSERNGGLRDLSKSKHRLTKGDYQLEFTYQSAMDEIWSGGVADDNVVPHHIGDIASDVTYYVYLARQTPKEVLCSRVRPRWVPEEYPSTIEKMYHWTPDESIPEFYTSPEIFHSIHEDLPNLGIPKWCSSPEELVEVHRGLLESDVVSAKLNHWIDLVFGYKLSGDAAVRAKNVYLSLVDSHTNPSNSGIVQLFRTAHPRRIQGTSAPLVFFHWQNHLNMTKLMNVTNFDITHSSLVCRNPQPSSSQPLPDEEKQKTLSAMLHENVKPGSFYHQLVEKSTHNKSDISDCSFEHLTYPTEYSDLMVATSCHVSIDLNVGVGMLSGMNSAKQVTGKYQSDPPFSGQLDTHTRPGILRGILRPKRTAEETEADIFDWQQAPIITPKDVQLLQPLNNIQELNHFLTKSCRDHGNLSGEQWTSEDLLLFQEEKKMKFPSLRILHALKLFEENNVYPSFEDRSIIDIAAVACTILELLCNKHIRATLPLRASLLTRFRIIQNLLKNGQLAVPCFLKGFANLIFSDDHQAGILVPSVLPSLSAALLLQQFVSLVAFPSYFAPLYSLLSELEKNVQKAGLAMSYHRWRSQENAKTDASVDESVSSTAIMNVLTEKLTSIYPQLDRDGLNLLLLYIFPLFDHPSTCFDAAFNLFDLLSEYLTRRHLQKILVPSFLFMFDTFDKPSHRCQIVSRLMADKLMKKFGLFVFLNRFLPCIIEVMIEPMANSSASKKSIPGAVEGQDSESPIAKELKTPAINHKPPLNRVTSSSLALNITWENRGYEFDEEDDDSGSETELSFPEASLLVGMKAASFDQLPDAEQNSSLLAEQGVRMSPLLEQEMQAEILVNTPSLSEQQEAKPPVANPSLSPENSQLPTGHDISCPEPVLYSTDVKDDSADSMTPTVPAIVVEPSQASFSFVPVIPPLSNDSNVVVQEEKMPEEGDMLIGGSSDVPTDPVTQAISSQISEVASDCIIWLNWRLGPLLATRHIAHQLLENIHRCFTNIVYVEESQSAQDILRCLASLVEYYGQGVVLHLYLPYISTQVSPLLSRSNISCKAEACLASSVAILDMCIKKSTRDTLLAITEDLCPSYFEPLFQLLSSKKHVFPSGTQARAIVCNSASQLLQQICRVLGRDRTIKGLMQVLKCFFNCFSTAHENYASPSPALLSPIEEFFSQEEDTSTGIGNLESVVTSTEKKPKDPANPTAVEQVTETFSPALIYKSYVSFCKLVGQIRLSKELQNVDTIEELYASCSDLLDSDALPSSLLGLLKPELSSSTCSSSGSDQDIDGSDPVYQLGPTTAMQGKLGLGKDAPSFGQSSWFVEMDTNQADTAAKEPPPPVPATSSAPAVPTKLKTALMSALAPPDLGSSSLMSQDTVMDPKTRGSALFEAKFGKIPLPSTQLDVKISDDSDCSLRGNWLDLWKSQVGQRAGNVLYKRFKALKLMSFSGHKSQIKSLCVQDSEHLFFSGSKDKTVKIWSLHNHGDGSSSAQAIQTYVGHQRTVVKVDTVANLESVVSCDGVVHLWDPETCYCIHQFASPRGSQFQAMEALPEFPSTVLVATSDLFLRFIDLRSQKLQHILKTHFTAGGGIRLLASAGNYVSVGGISASINNIDLRTGEILASWRPGDKWPHTVSATWPESLLHLKTTRRGNLLTSVGNGMVSLWKSNGKEICHLRGQVQNTPCLDVFGDQLLTTSVSGHVILHHSFESSAEYVSSTRIKGKEIRGNITCSTALEQNQMVLYGSDTGQIVLMA